LLIFSALTFIFAQKKVILDYIIAMLWSLSPFGEAKRGHSLWNVKAGLKYLFGFLLCFGANVLVFPICYFLSDKITPTIFYVGAST